MRLSAKSPGGNMSTGLLIAVMVTVVLIFDIFLFLFIRKLKLKARVSLESALSPAANGNRVTTETHAFKLAPDAMKRAKEMKDQGASMDEICRAIDTGYDARGELEKRALHMLVETMQGGVGNTITASLATHSEDLRLAGDTLARARALFADGAAPDDICRDVLPEYAGWDPARQEKVRALIEKTLKSHMA